MCDTFSQVGIVVHVFMFMHISKGVSRVIFFPLFLRVRLTPKLLFLVLVSHTNNRLLHYYHAQNMVCLLHMSIINNNKSIKKNQDLLL